MNLPGKWEFPGGKIQKGETEAAALQREIREELALEIEVLERLTPVREQQPHLAIELIPYRCRLVSGLIMLAEHQDYRWALLEELPGFDWCPADRPIVLEWLALQ